jgi:hypothetical protein
LLSILPQLQPVRESDAGTCGFELSILPQLQQWEGAVVTRGGPVSVQQLAFNSSPVAAGTYAAIYANTTLQAFQFFPSCSPGRPGEPVRGLEFVFQFFPSCSTPPASSPRTRPPSAFNSSPVAAGGRRRARQR